MIFEKISFYPGKITYEDFDIDINKPLDFEDDGLKEDMFKVQYPDNFILDIGWYSGVNKFNIYIIKDFDWDNPIKKTECDLVDLYSKTETYAVYIRDLLSN
ncbi:hypothetical protein GCM10010912_58350 [Paenibacillus albidus]|uniref:Uncharacterized protein n=1 Tax=Paenibacillus albidus TaxID=2041023 RepID=A0A917D1A6_9BACL|nr:hypothetical protein [Paenibacillus albidus]GGG06043.1 hypothetical protein GCM10010912_58350 [Paenibacillus albidus]